MFFNDFDIKVSYKIFDLFKGYGEGKGYLVEFVNLMGKFLIVLVIYENRGLNFYIKDVVCCFVKVGFIVFVLDVLYFFGGYFGNDDEGCVM